MKPHRPSPYFNVVSKVSMTNDIKAKGHLA